MASSMQKLYRVIVRVTSTKLECSVVEYQVLKFTDKNFILRYESSGQKTRMIGKEEIMKLNAPPFSNDAEPSIGVWALDDQISEAKEACMDELKQRIERAQKFLRKQLVLDYALLKSLKREMTTEHKTIEQVIEG